MKLVAVKELVTTPVVIVIIISGGKNRINKYWLALCKRCCYCDKSQNWSAAGVRCLFVKYQIPVVPVSDSLPIEIAASEHQGLMPRTL